MAACTLFSEVYQSWNKFSSAVSSSTENTRVIIQLTLVLRHINRPVFAQHIWCIRLLNAEAFTRSRVMQPCFAAPSFCASIPYGGDKHHGDSGQRRMPHHSNTGTHVGHCSQQDVAPRTYCAKPYCKKAQEPHKSREQSWRTTHTSHIKQTFHCSSAHFWLLTYPCSTLHRTINSHY